MDDDKSVAPTPSPRGIVDCLRMLAEEAAALRLPRTLMALLETAEICGIEASAITPVPGAAEHSKPRPPDTHLFH